MSTSSAEPDITIVVGSNGAPGSVERCLEALAPQTDGAEVLVCEPWPRFVYDLGLVQLANAEPSRRVTTAARVRR